MTNIFVPGQPPVLWTLIGRTIFYSHHRAVTINPSLRRLHFACVLFFISSTSDLQPNTPTANQLPGQLVSTEIRNMYKYKF